MSQGKKQKRLKKDGTEYKDRETANGDLGFSEQAAAKRIGLSYMSLYRRRKAGEVVPYRIGNRIIYTDDVLRQLLERAPKGFVAKKSRAA